MDGKGLQPPGNEPVDGDVGQSAEKTSEVGEAHKPDTSVSSMPDQVGGAHGEENETQEVKPPVGCPPTDWLEPLEDDEQGEDDEESLAGESERSHAIRGSESANKTLSRIVRTRRKRTHPDEGWFDFPELGEGWKRKEVIRQSGSSIGQMDVYYLSPEGYRVRSRVELMTLLLGVQDISNFDYKAGKFHNGEIKQTRGRRKRKTRERSSSESSWVDKGESAESPEFHPKRPSNNWAKSFLSNDTISQIASKEPVVPSIKIKLHLPSISKPHLSIKGQPGPDDKTLLCSKCGMSFIGTWYDRQRKRPSCPSCWASKTIEHPMIRLRKWIPCGQCVGCHMTVNCGQCANCKSPENRKRICRMRKCLCPIRKSSETESVLPNMPENDVPELLDDSASLQEEPMDSQLPELKSSENENFSSNMDFDDDDDYSTDDDDDWHRKRKRRACGECNACLCRKDCGTCDFCVDKPKFGGSNKKRQKCRLRQCQRQAMRHLLPFQMSQGAYRSDDPSLPGRPRPHYTYSRKTNLKRSKLPPGCWDFSDEDDDFQDIGWSSEPSSSNTNDINLMDKSKQLNRSILEDQEMAKRGGHQSNNKVSREQQNERNEVESQLETDCPRPVEEEDHELPMITQIFSLAANPVEAAEDSDNQLVNLLTSLRCTSLPILWYAVMAKGPQIQLVQCSKQSNMSDTIVLIDPGCFYQVTVQKQPLLPTHSLYRKFPQKLTSSTEVVSLLLGLEKYALCQGLPPKEPLSSHAPITLERASTCEFLVKKNVDVCFYCKLLCN
ncbi:methyl-CpG-binding domain protein 1b isoform X2 [Hippocampus comes]|uniref:Methyl-CpG binding domain protein 1b n=1 Tax=Hippocampus comes TaxID=109280 RepID=A0A3Q2YW61_HIPCM|nr:PREDICTED: methyl-CpG-binding domain protein 1 isoform X1 [Hippocampus comes]XP_019735084.1 PREDICTED: methyl-CpG-binding domain protein 1 isoform X1 [Hippocampus comes]XP_019735085.1 PREDICTED: methyl-CpG-binding domain protein 1 isoform X2 [Hippocampus comes]